MQSLDDLNISFCCSQRSGIPIWLWWDSCSLSWGKNPSSQTRWHQFNQRQRRFDCTTVAEHATCRRGRSWLKFREPSGNQEDFNVKVGYESADQTRLAAGFPWAQCLECFNRLACAIAEPQLAMFADPWKCSEASHWCNLFAQLLKLQKKLMKIFIIFCSFQQSINLIWSNPALAKLWCTYISIQERRKKTAKEPVDWSRNGHVQSLTYRVTIKVS